MSRPRIDFEHEGRAVSLVDSHRSESGLGLGYFLVDGDEPDRRARLEQDLDVTAMSPDELGALWEASAPLTSTERRFSTSDGEAWLAQSVGPVWGEGAAAGIIGLRLTCLTADRPVRRVPEIRLVETDDGALAAMAAGEG